jgi:hypothetical protein
MGTTMGEDRWGVFTAPLDPASVAAATAVEQTFNVPGLRVGDMVQVTKPSLSAGLAIGGARVSARDTLAVTFLNATAAPIDPGSESYQIYWFRPERSERP